MKTNVAVGFHVIGRFRNDADLLSFYFAVNRQETGMLYERDVVMQISEVFLDVFEAKFFLLFKVDKDQVVE